ncbi:hypothetical protein [Pedobacter jeongneungensis]|uniref:hypothetical protein n=1 Tax=Pedobacter jeongneungensis TaxID=947309 RepID=UPI0004692442|nr:hypothetical protein [Pedobacter jeongneungensis]
MTIKVKNTIQDYDLGITLEQRADVCNRAAAVEGICGTISAIEILNHFNIKLSDHEIKEGIKDDSIQGTNQVNMSLFMSEYLDVTYCVKYNLKNEIENWPATCKIDKDEIVEFSKLLGKGINFEITPKLDAIISRLKIEDAVAQFVFLQKGSKMTHYGLLCKVENNLLEFTQRDGQVYEPDVEIEEFLSWWDLNGAEMDPEQLVLIYKKKTIPPQNPAAD